MGRLSGVRLYLAGPIDRCPNLGVDWRLYVANELRNRYNAIPYNPMEKPCKIANEHEQRELRREWKKNGQYDKLQPFIEELVRVDFRMCDKSDAGIFYFDMDIFACGTLDELFRMNDQRKPCLIVCKQGIANIADWLFGKGIPISHMFDSFEQLFEYLDCIDISESYDSSGRWLIFDY